MSNVVPAEALPRPNAAVETQADQAEPGANLWSDAWRRLVKNKLALFGLLYLVAIVCVAIAAPWLTTYSYEDTDLVLGATAPSSLHWLGTDDLGRDMLTRIIFGARISLMVGVLATVVSVIIGVVYGAVAGFVGGRTDSMMMRLISSTNFLICIKLKVEAGCAG